MELEIVLQEEPAVIHVALHFQQLVVDSRQVISRSTSGGQRGDHRLDGRACLGELDQVQALLQRQNLVRRSDIILAQGEKALRW
jgi:hypothetical protein